MRTRAPSTPLHTTHRLILAVGFSLVFTLGCSQSPDDSKATADSEARSGTSAPIAAPQREVAEPGALDVLRIEGSVGGMPTSYSAYFDAAQLQRIAETRKPAGTGDYVFDGARLIEYQGTALDSAAVIELHFDPQGALVPPAAGHAMRISDSELSSIRTRAQLLRSLALARRATETHASQH